MISEQVPRLWQQAPLGDAIYRTFRWGRDLQVWFTDGRDFRSPNDIVDGPQKTIWGADQKAWFKRTVAESDATWKVLISPTPLVGPLAISRRSLAMRVSSAASPRSDALKASWSPMLHCTSTMFGAEVIFSPICLLS